jgi:AraC-like DNA-binding protein
MAVPITSPSGIYQFRRKVPEDLRSALGREYKRSLKTCDPVRAKRLYAEELVRCEAAFALARAQSQGVSILPRDPRLQRIARALIADPSDDRDLQRWAAWAAVSSRTLSRRFVTETGFNFTAWRQRARMMRSLEMLAAGMPVTAIAFDLGYSTPSAFIGLFRRTFGETPAAYRAHL